MEKKIAKLKKEYTKIKVIKAPIDAHLYSINKEDEFRCDCCGDTSYEGADVSVTIGVPIGNGNSSFSICIKCIYLVKKVRL
jgi:hypothetical protein